MTTLINSRMAEKMLKSESSCFMRSSVIVTISVKTSPLRKSATLIQVVCNLTQMVILAEGLAEHFLIE